MLLAAVLLKKTCPEQQECVVVDPPSELQHVQQHPGFPSRFGRIAPLRQATRVAAIDHQLRDPLGMAGSVFDGNRTALARRENGEAIETGCVRDRLEIPHPGFEGDVPDAPIRKAASARVVAEQRMGLGKMFEPGAPGQAFPLVLQMREPGRRHDEWAARAGHGVSDPHAIRTGAETNLLFHEPPRD